MRITTASTVPAPTRAVVANGGGADRNVFEREFDPVADRPSRIVVDAVAFIHNVDPVALEPLADAVDPEALDSLLAAGPSRDVRAVEVTFYYADFQISLSSAGRLWLRWAEERT